MNTPTITAIILTYNEEIHIKRCIDSLKKDVDTIIVVDSFSKDKTVAIAEENGALIYQNPFVNQAIQFNWALDHCEIKSEWILRIDADEYLESQKSIKSFLSKLASETDGILIKRKIVFLEKELLHGGWFPKFNLRIFRNGNGRCEERWMDEHIIVMGNVVESDIVLVDKNLNSLKWWIDKHNKYAEREVADFFWEQTKKESVSPKFWGTEAERKRFLKLAYINFPLFLRPIMNFLYRYIIRMGFLDGTSGFVWHVLQGFWYRFLVDAKIYELKLKYQGNQDKIKEHIKKEFQIK
ncbi:glycosyltransferase family 2 protein [Ochrovirga pacifica]|uniref:glycosyltransferase family 2 protein n=1 Tax=Ochrovirga pacifica TaxID=1042376 RepID=UPI000255A06E|nr:glycosyltransferase family 2 protein [Ochrovirga pacifica]